MQSRYYSPKMGRFISADSYVSTGQGILGNNMFAYCLNNPVSYIDDQGNMANSILIDGAIAGVVSLIAVAVTGGSFSEMLKAFLDSFIKAAAVSAIQPFAVGKFIKYGIIIYDVAEAIIDCWNSGASIKECAAVALVQLYAALSFDSVDSNLMLDLTVKLGTTLTATAVTEGVLENHNNLVIPSSTTSYQSEVNHLYVRSGAGNGPNSTNRIAFTY